ncbi:hypothetical protein EJB05_19243, partial [Eragrostis curvula]
MRVSRPAVHPLPLEVAAAPPAGEQQQEPEQAVAPPAEEQQQELAVAPPAGEEQQQEPAAEEPQGVPHGLRMNELPGTPGTPVALGLRFAQVIFAGVALAVMASTKNFDTVSAFCFLVTAAIVHGLWSALLAIGDIYALMVKRGLKNRWAVRFFAFGDVITAGLTFSAACASGGVTSFVDINSEVCQNDQCGLFGFSIVMMFMCLLAAAPTCVLNVSSVATPR